MNYQAKSIRAFIGSKDYSISKAFYQELGFTAHELSEKMIYFSVNEHLGFYLQNYYLKDWIDNSMVFLEVDDVQQCWEDLKAKGLPDKYKGVRLSTIQLLDWGQEFFLHDPSGVLWHFGRFK